MKKYTVLGKYPLLIYPMDVRNVVRFRVMWDERNGNEMLDGGYNVVDKYITYYYSGYAEYTEFDSKEESERHFDLLKEVPKIIEANL